jgi:hypothetical protein
VVTGPLGQSNAATAAAAASSMWTKLVTLSSATNSPARARSAIAPSGKYQLPGP